MISEISAKLPQWIRPGTLKLLFLLAALLWSPIASFSQNSDPGPELAITNSPSASIFTMAGEVISYSIIIKNIGNTPVFDINVSDPNAVLKTTSMIGSLLPGENTAVAADHIITQADLDAGKLVNQAKAAGFDQNGKPVEKTGRKIFILGMQHPGLNTSLSVSDPTYRKEGDLIEYTVVVENIGNITMNNIDVYGSDASLIFNRSIGSLAPGARDSVTAEYRISMGDVIAGKTVNAGIARAMGANNQLYAYPSNEVVARMEIENFNLSNFPNPFDTETTISFDLPEKGNVMLKIYDMTGREVGQIDSQEFSAGRNYVAWKANDIPKGFYTLKIFGNGVQAVRRIMVAR